MVMSRVTSRFKHDEATPLHFGFAAGQVALRGSVATTSRVMSRVMSRVTSRVMSHVMSRVMSRFSPD